MANIPYHIKAIGLLFPPLKSTWEEGGEVNSTTGEIRKFQFVDKLRNVHRTGERVHSSEFINGVEYDAVWVHLIQDYFKMIGLWKTKV